MSKAPRNPSKEEFNELVWQVFKRLSADVPLEQRPAVYMDVRKKMLWATIQVQDLPDGTRRAYVDSLELGVNAFFPLEASIDAW